ncbi:hypothetical protein SpCBS45565_g03944 [Spizellomyces sp. 'palustris']|nr:hypothetical protein SpCBS45565_g03944 [Spizellomyces sp. 'palustris']
MTLLESLLDEISSTTPVDFDPEKASADAIGLGAESNSETEGEDATATEHYVAVGRGKIRNQLGIDLEDPKYAGRKVSRKKAFEEEEEEESEFSDNLDMDGEFDSEDDEEGSDLDAMDIAQASDDEEDGEEEDIQYEESESHDTDEDEEDEEEDDKSNGVAEARLAKELQQLEVEEKKLIKSMSVSAKADVEKGQHVRSQISLWDSLLDGRIRIQRAVAVANRFPKPEVYPGFLTDKTSQTAVLDGIATASQELVTLVDELLDLRTALITNNEHVAEVVKSASNPRKRKRDYTNPSVLIQSIWQDIQPLDREFKDYRDKTIDKWNSKVQLASGIPLQRKFKAINQSTLSQIKQILGDKDRLIKRTQLRRSDYRCLGETEKSEADDQENEDSEGKGDAHLSNHDAEIFDDGDYYQQLLKELIETRMADTDDPVLLGMKFAQLKQMQQKQKKKKKVDTKASKGRKVRYHVHEKLQNFMAPEPKGTWHEEMVDELFAALLGQASQEGSMKNIGVVQEGTNLQSADGLKILVG